MNLRLLAIPLLALFLAACGGGEWEETDAGLIPVDCKTEPKRCT
jgi:hypothetical protein